MTSRYLVRGNLARCTVIDDPSAVFLIVRREDAESLPIVTVLAPDGSLHSEYVGFLDRINSEVRRDSVLRGR